MSIVLQSSGGGQVTLSEPSVAANVVCTLPSSSTSLFCGPAFSVYLSGNQSISSSTTTKIQFNTEQFDTNNCFDSTTNYRFTPTVAGYYQVNLFVAFNGTSSGTEMAAFIYKNGSAYRTFALYSSALDYTTGGSDIVYLNGSTDYLEFYGRIAQTSPYIQALYASGGTMTTVSASLVRAA